jgi:hypothetical protein
MLIQNTRSSEAGAGPQLLDHIILEQDEQADEQPTGEDLNQLVDWIKQVEQDAGFQAETSSISKLNILAE